MTHVGYDASLRFHRSRFRASSRYGIALRKGAKVVLNTQMFLRSADACKKKQALQRQSRIFSDQTKTLNPVKGKAQFSQMSCNWSWSGAIQFHILSAVRKIPILLVGGRFQGLGRVGGAPRNEQV